MGPDRAFFYSYHMGPTSQIKNVRLVVISGRRQTCGKHYQQMNRGTGQSRELEINYLEKIKGLLDQSHLKNLKSTTVFSVFSAPGALKIEK